MSARPSAPTSSRSRRESGSTIGSARTSCAPASATAARCFPKDSLALKQLASNSGYHFQLLAAVIEVNELQKRRVVQKLQKHLGKLRGKKIALLGLAFKAGTDDMREAPSLVLASRLLAEGAEVRAWDPVARPGRADEGRGSPRRRSPTPCATRTRR